MFAVLASFAVIVVIDRLSKLGQPDKVINSRPAGLLPELLGANVQVL